MSKYVPGTAGENDFGKTYEEVFTPGVSVFLKWFFRIMLAFFALTLVGNYLFTGVYDNDWVFRPIAIWLAGRVLVYFYINGVKMGMHYQKHGNTSHWD